jgi:hypothetical protein
LRSENPAALPRTPASSVQRLVFGAYALGWPLVPILAHAALPAGPTWLPLALTVALGVAGFVVWPVRTLALFVAFLMFVDTIELAAGDRISLTDEILVPLFAAITLAREWRRVRSMVRPIRDGAVLAFVLAGVASSLLHGVAPTIWVPGLALVIKGMAIFYVAMMLEIGLDDLRWVGRLFLGLGIVVLLAGFVELVAPGLFAMTGLLPAVARAGLPAIKSLFYHPQLFGWFCAVVALQLVAHHVVFRRPWMLVLSLVFSVGTILSARRRSIVALVAGLAAGIGSEFILSRVELPPRLRRWLPSTIGIIVLGIAFLPALTGLYTMTIENYVKPGSGGVGIPGAPPPSVEDTPARVALYTVAVQIARDDFPLGAGLGRYGSWISREQYSDLYRTYGLDRVFGLSPSNPQFITDTFWPEVLGETGVIGLIAYAVFLVSLGFGLWRALAAVVGSRPIVHAFVLGMVLIFVQSLVESIASAIFNSPSQAFLVMGGIGAAIGLSLREGEAASGATAVSGPTLDPSST